METTLGRAKGLIFTNYQGLTHKQIEGLKNAIKPLDADFAITKNTLLKIALKNQNLKFEEDKSLDGPTGTLFLFGDIIEPLKKLAKTIKDFSLPTIKFGIIDGKLVSGEQVIKLSSLPSRETLLTQVAFSLKSPIIGLHRALNWNLQKLVMTLSAVAMSKPAMAVVAPVVQPAAEASTETPAEEAVAEPAAEAVAEETTTEEASEPETPAKTTIPQDEIKVEEPTTEGGEN
jgi:large subunit ribosomal protein L10